MFWYLKICAMEKLMGILIIMKNASLLINMMSEVRMTSL